MQNLVIINEWNYLFMAYIFIIGLLIGSFLNVCVYRIPRGENIAFPPSHCTSCGNKLKWYDLFPVFSYLALGRKCRFCKEKISIRYMIVELFTGIMYLMVYLQFGFSLNTIKFIFLITMLIIIGLIDFDTTDVYLVTTLSGIIVGILFIALEIFTKQNTITSSIDYLYGALLGGGLITAIILLTKGMGWGDVEICVMCGLFLGFKLALVMLFLSFVIGAVAGITLILLKKKTRKDYIPFGPYIAIATIFAVLWGRKIIELYFILY